MTRSSSHRPASLTPFPRRLCAGVSRFQWDALLVLALALALAACAPRVAAAREALGDSLRPHRLDSVVVSAPRDDRFSSPAVGASTIEFRTASSPDLATSLNRLPGIAFQRYGGTGTVATMSVRGSGAQNVQGDLDGVTLNGPNHGTVDIGVLPLALLTSATIVAGTLRADADEGSAIVHFRHPEATGDRRAMVAFDAGSFGEMTAAATMSGSIDGIRAVAGVSRLVSDGTYRVTYNGADGTRVDNDAASWSGFARAAFGAAGGHDVVLWGTSIDRGAPGALTSIPDRGAARLDDRNAGAAWNARWSTDGALHISTTLTGSYADERYHDSLATFDGEPMDTRTIARSAAVSARMTRATDGPLAWTIVEREAIDDVSTSGVYRATRMTSEFMAAPTYRLARTMSGDETLLRMTIRSSAWHDDAPDAGGWHGDASLAVGAIVPIASGVTMRATTEFSHRRPTLNDLYWNPGGNPGLVPEQTVGGELGGHAERLFGAVTVDVAGWLRDTRNRIVWLPASSGIWSAANVDRVIGIGAGARASWSPVQQLVLSAGGDLASNKRANTRFAGDAADGMELPFLPLEQTHASIEWQALDALRVGATIDRSSFRYTTTDNSQTLAGYIRIDCSIESPFTIGGIHCTLRAACENLFDARYALVPGYPMPSRTVRAGVTLDTGAE